MSWVLSLELILNWTWIIPLCNIMILFTVLGRTYSVLLIYKCVSVFSIWVCFNGRLECILKPLSVLSTSLVLVWSVHVSWVASVRERERESKYSPGINHEYMVGFRKSQWHNATERDMALCGSLTNSTCLRVETAAHSQTYTAAWARYPNSPENSCSLLPLREKLLTHPPTCLISCSYYGK